MLIRLLTCSALLLTTLSAPAAAAPPSDPARAELRSIVESVSGATGKRYAVHDDAGHVMDTVKII
jgi:type IV secretory pathway VirB2 component (pilin)